MFLIKIVSHLFLASLFFINTANAANAIQIEKAWSPEAPPVAPVMAGYMKINNLSNKDIQINSVTSDAFKRVEIHLSEMNNGMMRMIKQENLNIKAKGFTELKPGGLHMMLIGKLKPLKAGDVIAVTLNFSTGEKINVNLKIKTDNPPQMKCGSM